MLTYKLNQMVLVPFATFSSTVLMHKKELYENDNNLLKPEGSGKHYLVDDQRLISLYEVKNDKRKIDDVLIVIRDKVPAAVL